MAEPWTNHENSVLVEAYMRLVESLMTGEAVVKTHVYREVSDRVGRGAKSVEFKMLNVSGVLVSLGYGFPPGLTPAHNFQASLVEVVQLELARHPRVEAFLGGNDVIQTVNSNLEGGVPAETPQIAHVLRAQSADPAARSLDGQASVSLDVITAEDEDFAIETLWDFATGGGDVAAAPGKPPAALRGPTPAAVDQAVDWMRPALEQGADRQRMLFLVGGPGGGKSFVASALTAGLKPLTAQEEGLAHRSYTYQASGGSLRVINDATIPPSDLSAPTHIAAELNSSQEEFVIACVNRGVLVDEAAREEPGTLGSLITNWLRRPHNAGGHGEHEVPGGPTLKSVGVPRSFVRQARATNGSGHEVDLLAVFVDVCSLLEERPHSFLEGMEVNASAYEVDVFDPGQDRGRTPAGKLVEALNRSLVWDPRGAWDPIAANVVSLSSPTVRNGLLSVLRAAEMASSQLFSYRELWGVLARSVAGSLPESISKAQLEPWFEAQAPELGESAVDFQQMRQLAAIRLHESLFAEDKVGRHPILRATTAIDPARDMVPGFPASEDLGWATPVMEAFAGAELGASPLMRLQKAADTAALSDMVTPFDIMLDEAFVRWIHMESDANVRAEASSWYGRYLTRLVALAHGYPAFAADIRTWTRARTLSPGLPPDLEKALTTLVSPRREPDDSHSKSLIPLFASRTEPIRGRTAESLFSVVVEDVKFTTSVEGEKLLLHLTEGVQPLGAVVLDLDLIREAMASSEGWTGMTDATETTEPRLERFRSLRLIPKNRGTSDLRIAGPIDDIALTVKEQL